jgi:hypothetical protein
VQVAPTTIIVAPITHEHGGCFEIIEIRNRSVVINQTIQTNGLAMNIAEQVSSPSTFTDTHGGGRVPGGGPGVTCEKLTNFIRRSSQSGPARPVSG